MEFVWKSVGDSVQRVRGGVVPVNEWSHIAVIVEDGEMLVILTVTSTPSTFPGQTDIQTIDTP